MPFPSSNGHGADRRAPSPSSGSRNGLSLSRSNSHHHDLDPDHDMESLHDVTDRCENKVGIVQISGRYHRYQDANHGFRSVRSLESDYVLTEKVLGTGYNGEVRMATSKERPEHKFAVKAFDFTGVPAQRRVQLESEVEVFLCMDHPHIARLVDVYERDQHMDLVMECMMGGELLDRIRERKKFDEKDTAQQVWQMLLALNYIHSHGMIHCDLKLENFMYDHKETNHLKLIDFGFSKMCDKKAELRRKACGTLSYTAPEVLDWSYTQQCDQWSLGVIVFVLLAGYMPFSGPEMEQMKNISTGTYVMKQERWSNISEEARAFTRALLQVDPKKRLTAETALDHPFISNRHFDAETQVDARIVKALRDFGHQSRFRRCCMSMMAWSLNHKELHFSDFLAAMINSHVELHEELVHEAFRKFDTDDSGYITVDNLRTVLGDTFEGQKVEKLLNEADTAHHGRLTYHEFASYLTGKEIHLHGDEGIGLELPMNESRHKMPKCNGNIQPCCSVQ